MDEIEELINKYFDVHYDDEIEFRDWTDDGVVEQFKKEMLKLLLPWRNFEKEKPEEGGRHIITYEVEKGCDFNFMEFINLDNDFNSFKYWMYKEDLLATLPKEKR